MSNLNLDLQRPTFLEVTERDGFHKPHRIPGLVIEEKAGQVRYPHFTNSQLDLEVKDERTEAVLRAGLYERTSGSIIRYGVPVDLESSNPETGEIVEIRDPGLLGMYVRAEDMSRFLLVQLSMNVPGNFEKFVRNQLRTEESRLAYMEAVRAANSRLPKSLQPRIPGL